jgi:hypothetical protein
MGFVHRRDGERDVWETEIDEPATPGKKRKISFSDPQEFLREHEFGKAGRQALTEAKKIKDQRAAELADLADALRTNPRKAMRDLIAAVGGDHAQVIKDELDEMQRRAKLTPEQQELEDRRAESKQRDDAEKARAAREKQEADTKEQRQTMEQMWTSTSRAMEASGLRPDSQLMRQFVLAHAEAQAHRGGAAIDFAAAGNGAKQGFIAEVPHVFASLSPQEVYEALGEKGVAAVLAHHAARGTNPTPLPTGSRQSVTTPTSPNAAGGGPAEPRKKAVGFVP